jgi:hypothetical protein
MAGMLQIITYLLCVYLIFKGVEILQIALMSSREDRAFGLVIGVMSLLICIGAAYFFYTFINSQAGAMSRSMPSAP